MACHRQVQLPNNPSPPWVPCEYPEVPRAELLSSEGLSGVCEELTSSGDEIFPRVRLPAGDRP